MFDANVYSFFAFSEPALMQISITLLAYIPRSRQRIDAYCQDQKGVCRRPNPSIHPLSHSSSGSNSDAKELHCLTPFTHTIVLRRSDYATLCNNRVCVCTFSIVCAVFRWLCVGSLYTRVFLCGLVCLHPRSMHLQFPGQGAFSVGDNNVYPEMQESECNLNLTLFCCSVCKVAHR